MVTRAPVPISVRVRAYQVGFGDCLLVTVTYDKPLSPPDERTEAHLLVDFGAKVLAKGGPRMADIAGKIVEHTGGHLDVVVATHRHQDHVRGFGDTAAKKLLGEREPGLIVRPWTDMPSERRDGVGDLGDDSRGFLGLLDTMTERSIAVRDQFELDQRVLAERAKELAALGVSNVEALAMLDAWAPPERTQWVTADEQVKVGELVPGVTIDVLGPPTLEQVPKMKSYASESAEYWLGMTQDSLIESELEIVTPSKEIEAKETLAAPAGLGRAAWLVDKLHDTGLRQVLEIVEGFDDVLNNTSLILLVTVGRRRLLLAGDAQVENWSYSLDLARGENGRTMNRSLRDKLKRVDLYKVGHHGSRNATPKRLVDLWSSRTDLCSVLSTREGVYGTTAEGKVPKQELIDALGKLGHLHTTDGLPKKVWWFDLTASTTSKQPEFEYAQGPEQP